MPISACKKQAKLRLKARRLRAFRITLSIFALAVLSGFAAFCLPLVTPDDDRLRLAAQLALCIICFGFLGTLRQGRTAWLYCCACGKEPSGVQFLYWIRRGRGLRAAWLHAMLFLRKSAWTLLLCLPGAAVLAAGVYYADRQTDIMRYFTLIGGAVCLAIGLVFSCLICQKFALAPILFARNPKKGVRSAVRASGFLMDGSCLRLFLLKLSFLPWIVPCAAVLPLVYILPYYQQSEACMLREILRAHTI